MTHFRIREWGNLPIGSCVRQPAATRLVAVAERAKARLKVPQPVLALAGEPHKPALRAGQVVGIVAAGNDVVEILPKVDGTDEEVRGALVRMLAAAWDLRVADGELTSLGSQREDLLELLIGLFSRRLLVAVRRGMPRRYIGHEEDLPHLRGKLDVTRQFTRLFTRPDRLACRFEELSENTPLNRLLKSTVTLLRGVTRLGANARLLAELAARLELVGESPAPLLEPVRLDRTNTAFHDLHRMARVFLEGDWQTTSAGDSPGFALLFPMNDLFEKFVAAKLRSAVAGVDVQPLRHHALQNGVGRGLFWLKPDLVVCGDIVIDTKWKRLDAGHDVIGVAQADVYQMLAYGHAYEAKRLVLLYPWHKDLDRPAGVLRNWRGSGACVPFDIATVDVGKPASVAEQLRCIVQCGQP